MRGLVWVLCLAAFFAVAAYALQHYPARVEADLRDRVTTALTAAGIGFAQVRIDGQTVILSGVAPDEDARARASKTAHDVWGVTDVREDLTIGAPELTAAATAEGLQFADPSLATDAAPSTTETPATFPEPAPVVPSPQDVIAPANEPEAPPVATAEAPVAEPAPAAPAPTLTLPEAAGQVAATSVTQAQTAPAAPSQADVPAPPPSSPSQQFASLPMSSLPSGSVTHALPTPQETAAPEPAKPEPAKVEAAPPKVEPPKLEAAPPQPASVMPEVAKPKPAPRIVAPPAAKVAPVMLPPPTYHLTTRLQDRRVVLEGLVSTPSARRALVARAKQSTRRVGIRDDIDVANTKPDKEWLAVAKLALSQLALLESGSFELNGRALTFKGRAKTKTARIVIMDTLKTLPHGFTSTVSLEREVAPPEPPPQQAVEQTPPAPRVEAPTQPVTKVAEPTRSTTTADLALGNAACRNQLRSLFMRSSLNFDEGSTRLADSGARTLDAVAQYARNCPTSAIVITGHTDSREAPGAAEMLSRRRADAVREALVTRGVGAGQLSVRSLGASHPIFDNATEDGRAENRRVEFGVR